jgi:predicted phosphodiesterase
MTNFIGVLGDIHGEHLRVHNALRFFERHNVEQVLAVGDVADGPGNLQACVDLLRESGVLAVRGNHDDWFLRGLYRDVEGWHAPDELDAEGRAWLDAQPLMRRFETPSGTLLLCHGVGGDFMQNLKADDYGYALECNAPLREILGAGQFRWMINGHTHMRMVKRFGNLTNLNAGKVGDRKESQTVGGVWLVDFQKRRAWLHLFEGDEVGEPGVELELP